MPEQRNLKQRIRARMDRTGESFATARRQLVLEESGRLYVGVGETSGRPVHLPLWESPGPYNLTVSGEVGTGKTVMMRSLLLRHVRAGGAAIVVDDCGVYRSVASALKGRCLRLDGAEQLPDLAAITPALGEVVVVELLDAKAEQWAERTGGRSRRHYERLAVGLDEVFAEAEIAARRMAPGDATDASRGDDVSASLLDTTGPGMEAGEDVALTSPQVTRSRLLELIDAVKRSRVWGTAGGPGLAVILDSVTFFLYEKDGPAGLRWLIADARKWRCGIWVVMSAGSLRSWMNRRVAAAERRVELSGTHGLTNRQVKELLVRNERGPGILIDPTGAYRDLDVFRGASATLALRRGLGGPRFGRLLWSDTAVEVCVVPEEVALLMR